MQIKRCPIGHYYDADENTLCPYCLQFPVTESVSPSEDTEGSGTNAYFFDPVYDNPDFSYTHFIDSKKKHDDMNKGVSPFDEPLRDSCDPEYISVAEIDWQLFTQSTTPVQKPVGDVLKKTTGINVSDEDTIVFITLWSETADGPMGGVGEHAVFLPRKNLVTIHGWGPGGERNEEISIPSSITTREEVLRYLQDDNMFARNELQKYEEHENSSSGISAIEHHDREKEPERSRPIRDNRIPIYSANTMQNTPAGENETENETEGIDRLVFELFTDIGKATADPAAFRQRMTELQAAKNRHLQENCNDPDYGLAAEKPVFVKGFGMDKEYLSHLYTPDGKKLSYSRTGSIHVAGIAGPVDQYIMYLPNKSEYKRIFISVYGSTTSTKAPRGIIYR